MKIYVSLRVFWFFLIAGFSVFALLVWFWLMPDHILEYKSRNNLFKFNFHGVNDSFLERIAQCKGKE